LCSGWVIGCAAVWLGAIGLTSLFGLVQIGRIGVQGYERTVVSLLNLVQYLVPLLALLLGHDLVVSEREERTLSLILASGVKRWRVLAGKFIGASLVLAVPLVLGFAISGAAIGLATRDNAFAPFLRLAASGLVLGIVFLGLGLLVSTLCRTRVQALVFALLAWCAAVFVFDLVAMGLTVTTQSPQAAREVEAATDATHVNAIADIHAAYEKGDDAAARIRARAPEKLAPWMLLNPVDLFRVVNLPGGMVSSVPLISAMASIFLWIAGCLLAAGWKLRRIDL
jgi:ABC-type transport system involved in multi-copper enzyme maturation permease subunit